MALTNNLNHATFGIAAAFQWHPSTLQLIAGLVHSQTSDSTGYTAPARSERRRTRGTQHYCWSGHVPPCRRAARIPLGGILY